MEFEFSFWSVLLTAIGVLIVHAWGKSGRR